MRLMSKADALLYAVYRIRVSSIDPGFICTRMVEGYLVSQGGDLSSIATRLMHRIR